jgi:hypothetical protein
MLACPACRQPVPYTPIQCPTCGKGLGHKDAVWLGAERPAGGGGGDGSNRRGTASLVLAIIFGGLGLLGLVRLLSQLSTYHSFNLFNVGLIVLLFVAAANRFSTWSKASTGTYPGPAPQQSITGAAMQPGQAPPWPGASPAGPPPQRRAPMVAIVAAVVVLAVLAGLAGLFLAQGGTQSAGPATPSADAQQQLSTHFMKDPAGFTREPDNTKSGTGPWDLTTAASHDKQPGSQAKLQADGFVAGYGRSWSTISQGLGSPTSRVLVFIYQFGSADGATKYAQHAKAGMAANPVTPLNLNVPGGLAAGAGTSNGTEIGYVIFTRGSRMGILEATDLETAKLQLLSQQQSNALS